MRFYITKTIVKRLLPETGKYLLILSFFLFHSLLATLFSQIISCLHLEVSVWDDHSYVAGPPLRFRWTHTFYSFEEVMDETRNLLATIVKIPLETSPVSSFSPCSIISWTISSRRSLLVPTPFLYSLPFGFFAVAILFVFKPNFYTSLKTPNSFAYYNSVRNFGIEYLHYISEHSFINPIFDYVKTLIRIGRTTCLETRWRIFKHQINRVLMKN